MAAQRRVGAQSAIRTIGLCGCAFAALGAGWYSSRLLLFIKQDSSSTTQSFEKPLQTTITRIYDRTADQYDDSVSFFESVSGINRIRRRIVGSARGRVLEVGVGTGRNIEYYRLDPNGSQSPTVDKVNSILFVDPSRQMLEIARRKWNDQTGSSTRSGWQLGQGRVKWWCGSLDQTDDWSHDRFDTVVQTMTLCSAPDPVKQVQKLVSLVEPDGGRVVMLEHGRSHYNWLNSALDRAAPEHADAHGCWWNRDIGQIVEQAGVDVKSIRRRHLGTLWEIELGPLIANATE